MELKVDEDTRHTCHQTGATMTDDTRAVDKLRIAKAYRIAWADGVEPTNVWGIDCPCADENRDCDDALNHAHQESMPTTWRCECCGEQYAVERR